MMRRSNRVSSMYSVMRWVFSDKKEQNVRLNAVCFIKKNFKRLRLIFPKNIICVEEQESEASKKCTFLSSLLFNLLRILLHQNYLTFQLKNKPFFL